MKVLNSNLTLISLELKIYEDLILIKYMFKVNVITISLVFSIISE